MGLDDRLKNVKIADADRRRFVGFASAALTGLCANPKYDPVHSETHEALVLAAYGIAAEMIVTARS